MQQGPAQARDRDKVRQVPPTSPVDLVVAWQLLAVPMHLPVPVPAGLPVAALVRPTILHRELAKLNTKWRYSIERFFGENLN